MDRDFDGKLSFEEFMGEETALERLFQSMDKDGDGAVTKEVCCIFYNLLSGGRLKKDFIVCLSNSNKV